MAMAAMQVAWRTLGADHTRRTPTDERGKEAGQGEHQPAAWASSSWLGVERRQRRPGSWLAASPREEGTRPGSGGRLV